MFLCRAPLFDVISEAKGVLGDFLELDRIPRPHV